MLKLYDGFRAKTAGDKVECLNCGAMNEAGAKTCENCDKALEQPASLLVNALETIIRPQRAMQRIAATAPIKQAFLVVIAMIAVYIFVGAIITQLALENILNDLNSVSDLLRKQILELREPPVPGLVFILSNFFFLIISWLLFSLGILYAGRMLYRKEARLNFVSLASIVGFARITTLASLIFILPLEQFSTILSILLLLWQLGLITVGVRFSTGLPWTRTILIVLIPALLFRFLLQLPI